MFKLIPFDSTVDYYIFLEGGGEGVGGASGIDDTLILGLNCG